MSSEPAPVTSASDSDTARRLPDDADAPSPGDTDAPSPGDTDAGGASSGTGNPATDPAEALRLLDVEGAPPGTFGELEPTAPPLTDAQGRIRLSFSRVDTYANCPRKFRYAYVDRLPGLPGPHLSFGTSIHTALEAFYDRKLPECPTQDELLDLLYEAWDPSGFRDRPREEQLRFYRHAQDVLRRYHQRVADSYRLPATTEAWFELPIEHEAVVVGSIDRVDVDDDGRFHVVDYKTNRKVQPRSRVAGSLQLAIYALACRHLFGTLPASVALDFVVPGVEIRVPIEDIDLDGARQRILATARAIRAEAYEPTPNRLCDWCDYRDLCPAWPTDGSEGLGAAVDQLGALRRRLVREVRELRELESGVHRLATEMAADDQG